ncbi:ATPase P [Bordetella trematum]|uniref:P-type Zn(2+) transporter n=1 Tax=Bordetella trematum TaxID=123899 RepID=A0A157KMK0_9BORD|nr:heavy metal translocating P-type ATPase [Bordetella trematum]AZR93947.1 ATPase P [Bordetella trematum]NNH18305.1 heavy metal translocating P-type ATPase [Bordetella trematum]SAH85903.1 cadmium-transporting ATPase [Bordetella trematum]SAI72273.1 cadmium-transporting ATPase [Bordetella trematum]SUV97902.1 cadmium-transporting ATPase [Bordetella trematum]
MPSPSRSAAPDTRGACCGQQPASQGQQRAHDTACQQDHSHEAGHQHSHSHDHAHDHDHDHDHSHPAAAEGGECCGAQGFSAAPLRASDLQAGPGQTLSRLRIGQMDCPTEETLIRKKLGGMNEVRELDFNLMQRVLTVVHDDGTLEGVMAAVRSLDMTPELIEGDAAPAAAPQAKPAWRMLAVGGVLAALSEAVHFAGWPVWVTALFALGAIAACGLGTYRKGWIAVRNGNLNINALMSIAVTGAVFIGQWPEAAMVMALFNVAELIEARALDRARNAVRGLMDLAPQTALRQDANGEWIEVPAAQLRVGDSVRVRPGERIAADGAITEGQSAIDQSPITGESMPVEKAVGDEVFAGTVNTSGSFDYRVTAGAGSTTLDRIIHAVEQAQGARAPTQRFIDSFSRVYTPTMVVIALLVAIVPPLVVGQAWLEAIYRALALLIIACPCALVISTPVSVVSGLTAAARRGILIKGGVYLENGRKLRWLALDKTGTLTRGKPVQTDLDVVEPVSQAGQSSALILSSLASRSDHPVSRALAQAAAGTRFLEVSDFQALAGRGVSGRIGEETFYLGNRRLMRELGVLTPEIETRIDAFETAGKTANALSDGQRVLALAAVADTLKPTSAAAIADLHTLGVKTLMLTGDNARTAQAVAREAGIDEAHGDLLPEDKLTRVAAKHEAGDGMVGMVGDGINDAPALARADIGFAMGAAGTGTAIETADVALMDDDLRKIGTFLRLSRATHRILTQNITLALGIKAIFLVLAVSGDATLWMAVFADVGASLLVVANGLRLLRAGQGR